MCVYLHSLSLNIVKIFHTRKASADHLTTEDMKEYKAGRYGPKNIFFDNIRCFSASKHHL